MLLISSWYASNTSFSLSLRAVSEHKGFLSRFSYKVYFSFRRYTISIQCEVNVCMSIKSTICPRDFVKGGTGWLSDGKWTNLFIESMKECLHVVRRLNKVIVLDAIEIS